MIESILGSAVHLGVFQVLRVHVCSPKWGLQWGLDIFRGRPSGPVLAFIYQSRRYVSMRKFVLVYSGYPLSRYLSSHPCPAGFLNQLRRMPPVSEAYL